jgi:hypothetical protein
MLPKALTNKDKVSRTFMKREHFAATAENTKNPHEMGTFRISTQHGRREMMLPSEPPH